MSEVRVLCTDGSVVGPFTEEEMKKFEKAYKVVSQIVPWSVFFSNFFREELGGRECKHIWNEV